MLFHGIYYNRDLAKTQKNEKSSTEWDCDEFVNICNEIGPFVQFSI